MAFAVDWSVVKPLSKDSISKGEQIIKQCGILEVEVVNNTGIVYNQSLTRMTGPMEKGNYLPTHIIIPIARIG